MRFLVIILCSVISLNISAQCTKGIECKGDRICVGGKCVFPEDIKQEISKEEYNKPIELTQKQKKKIAGAVIFNLITPFNVGHHYNDDHLIGGISTISTVAPFTITMVNYFVKHDKQWDYAGIHDLDSADNKMVYLALHNDTKNAETVYMITGITTGTIYILSSVIAGIRRSKIEKGILVRKKRVSLVPDYDLIKKQTSLSLNYKF